MALADKDRIFTNLYGYQPWNLAAARARGDEVRALHDLAGLQADVMFVLQVQARDTVRGAEQAPGPSSQGADAVHD